MPYSSDGQKIYLVMTQGEYHQLLMILGFALGGIGPADKKMFYHWLKFVNDLNAGNAAFIPYEIPKESK